MFLSRTDFHRILKDAEQGQVMQGIPREFEPFGDLVTEIGDWTIRDDWDNEAEMSLCEGNRERLSVSRNLPRPGGAIGPAVSRSGRPTQPVSNPYRYVGRNDPCPCGSGKKFKRCCGQWK